MSANLTSEMNNTNKVVVLINECRKLNIKVHAPDINKSGINFEPLNDKEISFGLNAVKNVGVKALEQCIEVRNKHGEFKSIFDFISKVDQRLVNKKVLESLILAGAFDSLNSNRAQLFEAVDLAITYGNQVDKNSNRTDALSDIYKVLRPGEPPSFDVANEIFNKLFFTDSSSTLDGKTLHSISFSSKIFFLTLLLDARIILCILIF